MITSFGKTMCDFSFRGRSTRKEFLNFIIISTTISLLLASLITALAFIGIGYKINPETGNLIVPRMIDRISLIVFAALIGIHTIFNAWAFISGGLLAIRRLHDINCSGVGYWVWMALIVFFCTLTTSVLTGFLFYLIIGTVIALCIKDSFPYENKYGKVKMDEMSYSIENQHG